MDGRQQPRRGHGPGETAASGLERITAVILNWNQPGSAIHSAESLIGDGVPADRIVVVDNGSTDGSWERFLVSLRDCHLVRTAENVGFARGNNAGAEALPGGGYLFVNSDAFVHRPGSVPALVRALESTGTGVVVPKLLNDDLSLQPSVVPMLTPGASLARASGLSRLIPNDRQPDWGVYWDHGSSREVQGAIGPVMLVHAALWEQLRGFRESSFMYAEDLDLCWRAREREWRVQFVADSEFVHVGGVSTVWARGDRAERVGRAEAAMIREHLSPLAASVTLSVLRAGYLTRSVFRRLAGDSAAADECARLARGYGEGSRSVSPGEAEHSPETFVLRPDAQSEVALAGDGG